MSTVIAAKSCAFIEQHKDQRFFLEVATHNIHVPRVPNPKFRGDSQCGVRGDTIVEFDWTVGQVLDTLDRLKLADNTLVIVTSDNGGVLDNNGPDAEHGIGSPEANNGHVFNGVLRGTKGTIWEGGTRLPFIARWPRPHPARRVRRADLPGGHAGQFRRADRTGAGRSRRSRQLQRPAGPAWARKPTSRAASISSNRTTPAPRSPCARAVEADARQPRGKAARRRSLRRETLRSRRRARISRPPAANSTTSPTT